MHAPHATRDMPMLRTAATPFACALLLFAGASATAQAPTRLKPGLWEHGFQASSQGGQLAAALREAQKALANAPPEQRKLIEQLAAQQGVSLDAGGGKVRLCLTPEDVARDEIPAPGEGCTQTATRSGDTLTVNVQCPARDGQPASGGRGTVTLQGPTGYAGDFTMNGQVGGKPEQVTVKTQGRWLSADCGSVKPNRR